MTSRIFAGCMLIAGLAACGAEGGELAQDTARRRAEAAGADTLSADSAVAETEPGRIPAFVRDSAALAGPARPAPADSAAAPAATPAPAPADPAAAWSASVTDRLRTVAGPVVLSDLRVGVNAGFDRVVMEFLGSSVPGYRVEYVDRAAQCGSGDRVRVGGEAMLAVTLRGTQAHDETGRPTVGARERRLQMPVVKEYEFSCDFEGEVQVILGVTDANRYRVTELQNPARLIVDVQQ